MKFSTEIGTYHYEVYGKGPALVMLHGFTGSRQTWYPFIEEYKRNFQLILVDLPGHGETEINTVCSIAECCRDLNNLFSHLNLKSINLLGYSMGGRTALSFAMYYPEMVDMLILESVSPGLSTSEERNQRINRDTKLAQWIEKVGVHEFVNYWENIALFDTQKKLSTSTQLQIRNERLNQSASGLSASLKGMGTGTQPDWWPKLKELKSHVLLIVGEYDSKFINTNKKMFESIKNSRLEKISNAGHAIHVEQPEKFGKMVKEFILAQD